MSIEINGKQRTTTFGQQVGTVGVNTLANGDISGVRTINLQPYPPTNAGGVLPVGTVNGAPLQWNGSAWVQNNGVVLTGSDVQLGSINSTPWPLVLALANTPLPGSPFTGNPGTGAGFGATTTLTRVGSAPFVFIAHTTIGGTLTDVPVNNAIPLKFIFTLDIANALAVVPGPGLTPTWTLCNGTIVMHTNDNNGASGEVRSVACGVVTRASTTTATVYLNVQTSVIGPPPPATATYLYTLDLTALVDFETPDG